ncbi:MAG: hypothetical protein HY078_17215 [Elusimicrobia bacterium]|nr:hypothetical protein [Elusimicrobiota bacterium]
MGRTLPTIVQALRAEEEGWKHFRRALRAEDQEAFDALWRFARRHAAPASMASRPMPFEAAFMGMLVGLQRQVLDVERRILALEQARRGDGNGKA